MVKLDTAAILECLSSMLQAWLLRTSHSFGRCFICRLLLLVWSQGIVVGRLLCYQIITLVETHLLLGLEFSSS